MHTKGYDIYSKVSKRFWSFSASQQLRFILSLFEFHFWVYPPIYVLWNEFQDSHHENSDIKFFTKTTSPVASGTKVIKVPHTIEIECQNCPKIIKKDDDIDERQTPNNIIKMVCTCTQGLVAAEACYTTLFTMLNPRRYRHYHYSPNDTPDNIDHDFICSVQDYISETKKTKSDKDKQKLSTEMGTLSCTKSQQTLTKHEQRDLRQKPENTWIWLSPRNNSFENASATHHTTFPFSTTGHGLCKHVCSDQNALR